MRPFYLSALIAVLLRLAYLDSAPPGFFQDEAATGYDAYSLQETGKNRHGENPACLFQLFRRL